MEYSKYWNGICQIYLLTKHYLLLSEELSEGFNTFLQPLKEERDAFDHIIRVYGYDLKKNTGACEDKESYCNSNMRKAVQHTYRAFFDTADFFNYICQKRIRELLKGKDKEKLCEVYPKYEEAKKILEEVPVEIARIRENKDENSNENELVKEVEQYRNILDRIYEIYIDISRIYL